MRTQRPTARQAVVLLRKHVINGAVSRKISTATAVLIDHANQLEQTLDLISRSVRSAFRGKPANAVFGVPSPSPPKPKVSLAKDDPIINVLRHVLDKHTGKLRISDACLICGFDPDKIDQAQIEQLGRAIRELGWERARRRFDGSLQYAYVKGTASQRRVKLIVEHNTVSGSVVLDGGKRRP